MRIFALIAIIGALFSASCADPVGNLVVQYRVSLGADTCSTLGIDVIRVHLQAAEAGSLPEQSEPCIGSSGSISLSNVPVDVYTVVVEGIDDQGNIIYTGEETNVAVYEGQLTETDEVNLRVTPPSLNLIWRFTNGFMCSYNGVGELDIELWLRGSGFFGAETVDCESQQPFLMDENLVVGAYDLQVRAVDLETGDYTYFYNSLEDESYTQNGIELAAGRPVNVLSTLSQCTHPCDI